MKKGTGGRGDLREDTREESDVPRASDLVVGLDDPIPDPGHPAPIPPRPRPHILWEPQVKSIPDGVESSSVLYK